MLLQLVSEDLGMKLEKVTADMLGSAKKVTISKDDTIILDGIGDKKAIEERCEQVLCPFIILEGKIKKGYVAFYISTEG